MGLSLRGPEVRSFDKSTALRGMSKNKPSHVRNSTTMSDTDNQSVDENAQKDKEKATETKVKKVEDTSAFITQEEFVNINFDLEWPRIIVDLAEFLTG